MHMHTQRIPDGQSASALALGLWRGLGGRGGRRGREKPGNTGGFSPGKGLGFPKLFFFELGCGTPAVKVVLGDEHH